MSAPVTEALFELVDDYVFKWQRGKLSRRKKRLRQSHPLVVFCESFLEQFARNHLRLKRPMQGMTLHNAQRLTAIRRRLLDRDKQPATRAVIFSLEPICELLAEASYDRAEAATAEFHGDYFPTFLRCVVAWARDELEDDALTERAEETLDYYEGTVDVDAEGDDG